MEETHFQKLLKSLIATEKCWWANVVYFSEQKIRFRVFLSPKTEHYEELNRLITDAGYKTKWLREEHKACIQFWAAEGEQPLPGFPFPERGEWELSLYSNIAMGFLAFEQPTYAQWAAKNLVK